MSDFDTAFAIVVGIEGVYSADSADPGGATKYGISKRAYPNLDIAALTLDDAKAIYLQDYWDACACSSLSWERALCVFDTAVNQGQGVARSLNVQAYDVVELMAQRALRYVQNPEFDHFGHGWMRRLFTIYGHSQQVP